MRHAVSEANITPVPSMRPGRGPITARMQLPRIVGHAARSYDARMTKPLDEVLAEALRLDIRARATIVTELLASLDGPPDAGAATAWEAEIQRRVAAIEAGTVKLEPWEDVRRRIEKDLRRG
jgi:putative addiction module component (TIGR02574 family)